MSARAASEESSESTSSLDEESRLEALERGVRRKQGVYQDFTAILLQPAMASLSQTGNESTWNQVMDNVMLYA